MVILSDISLNTARSASSLLHVADARAEEGTITLYEAEEVITAILSASESEEFHDEVEEMHIRVNTRRVNFMVKIPWVNYCS